LRGIWCLVRIADCRRRRATPPIRVKSAPIRPIRVLFPSTLVYSSLMRVIFTEDPAEV
jgi:hypothetical protein